MARTLPEAAGTGRAQAWRSLFLALPLTWGPPTPRVCFLSSLCLASVGQGQWACV